MASQIGKITINWSDFSGESLEIIASLIGKRYMIWSDSSDESDDGDMTPIEILEKDTDPEDKSANLRKIDALHELGVETKLWSVRDEPKDVYQDVVRCYEMYKKKEEETK